jgi:hypothetical protein
VYRRFVLAVVAVTCVLPSIATAASWHRYSSKSFGFELQYPSGWQLTASEQPRQVALQYQGSQVYSLQVSLLAVKPASSMAQTLSRVKNYERSLGDAAFNSVQWKTASIGGRVAVAGVFRPSTEGGVAISTGIYLTASRAHVYELTVVDYRRPPAKTLARFPTIYSQILKTWKFL